MQRLLSNIKESMSELSQTTQEEPLDCQDILNKYGLPYREIEQYLQIGNIPLLKGWILDLSAIRINFTPLLKAVIPSLIAEKVTFRIPRNKKTVKDLLIGSHGIKKIGRLVTVYPENNLQALKIAKKLIELTQQFKGPAIPKEIWLGGTVYTRYGIFDTALSANYENKTNPLNSSDEEEWPFDEIIEQVKSIKKVLWNNKYRQLAVIKPDVKGAVIQANYFKGPFNIKLCIIKEGKKDMWADEFGRDIVARLEWQFELYRELAGYVPTPEIFDFWQEHGNTYLAMEFIKGASLSDKVTSIYNNKSWFELSMANKLALIDYYFKIVSVIGKLHEKGYVHRDITPANFIITKKEEVYLIDMELSYSIQFQKPNPAFKQGTPGFMSPEQEVRQTPTVKEDIYALGALLIFVLTNLNPSKFSMDSEDIIISQLSYFTDSLALITIIQNCLSKDPQKRPTISTICEAVQKYILEIKTPSTSIINSKQSRSKSLFSTQVEKIINRSIAGLNNQEVMTPDEIWTSQIYVPDSIEGPAIERAPNIGFQTGMTGVLYLLGIAKRLGYTIDNCLNGYNASWDYLKAVSLAPETITKPGLFDGLAGIALAINEGLNSRLLTEDIYLPNFHTCFSSKSDRNNLSTGLAGQGIALLRCKSHLPNEFTNEALKKYVTTLLEMQDKDGSWKEYRNSGKKEDKITGFFYGTAGILCFLIGYAKYKNDEQVFIAIQKGLWWLSKKELKIKNNRGWGISTKSKSIDYWSISNGTPGISLTFIKAYALLKEPMYKKIVEKSLQQIPRQPALMDFTQSYGLAGLGETYLEAFRAFQDEEWHDRANWIKGVFEHTLQYAEGDAIYWLMNIIPEFEPNLMTGISGILHFLIRTQHPQEVGDPLLGLD